MVNARPVNSHLLLNDAERHTLLIEWNATQADYPRESCLHHLFEQHAQHHPDVPALVVEEQTLTYEVLNARANQLARYLQALGVGPEVPVGVCMERSLDLVISVLAILKAGGAYVPLDPAYPQERLAFLVHDSQAPIVLTQASLRACLPEETPYLLCVEREWGQIVVQDESNLFTRVTSQNIAYIIYTSGSTGSPKGVCCAHAGVLNLLQDFQEKQPLLVGDHGSLWTSINFDVSVYEIFSCLCHGGTLYPVPELIRSQAAALLPWMSRFAIESAYIAPFQVAELAAWVREPEHHLVLKRLLVGVEPIQEALLNEIALRVPGLQIINGYGPTEATVCVTLYPIDPTQDLSRITPLGRPVHNIRIYVLNEQMEPVPIGVEGEIFLAGEGLARGYWQRAELTAERFVPDPFAEQAGGRLYRTGDRGRYLPDGNLQFLGRRDQQIKLRGFRVELGEIEAVFGQHPAIRDVLVVVRESMGGSKRLVVYAIPKQSPLPSTEELRRYGQDQLPDYMVPSAFVWLQAFPLTPNGKVDRNALLTLDELEDERAIDYVAPRTPTEEMVAALWNEVLQKRPISINDNFFEIGGDSLLASRILFRIREMFGVELPFRLLFNTATIAALTALIEQVKHEKVAVSLSSIDSHPRDEFPPLSVAQQRLWLLEQLAPGTATYTIPLALQLKGKLNIPVLQRSLNEIVSRHEMLRTSFTVIDDQPVQVIVPTLSLCITLLDLQGLLDSEREAESCRLIAEQIMVPFDLQTAPLLRIHLFHLQEQEHMLLVSMHHLISDGWSMGVFLHELAELYQAYAQGQASPLPKLSLHYADFASWQRTWLETVVIARHLPYWKQQLADAPALLELPLDHARPAVQTFHGGAIPFHLASDLTQQLKALSQQEGVTLFMTLLAAFQVLLFRYSGQTDVVVGTPVAGRTHRQIEDVIGFFVNTVVLRCDLGGNPCFRDLLKRVREVALDAYTHQEMPFERLVAELQPDRDLSYNPLFQVLFVLQNAPMQIANLLDIEVQSLTIEPTSSQFDLALNLSETGEGLEGYLEYNSDLFEADTVRRMAEHLYIVLTHISLNPDQSIRALSLLNDAERHTLLIEWNATEADYPRESCLHHLFEQQAEQRPDALAVVVGEQTLTYEVLNGRANQLAHYLQALGVGPEVPVGVCMERSLDLVVSVLAILKAGGAYVPLDPAYPQERLAFLMHDSQAPIVLTQVSLLYRFSEQISSLICLDRDWQQIALQPEQNPSSRVQPRNLAYIIYTSGSTGKPKGVCCAHRGVLNLLDDFQKKQEFLAGDRSSLWTSINFDVSVYELFSCLCHGGTLYLVPELIRSQSAELFGWLALNAIQSAYIAPFHVAELAAWVREPEHHLVLKRLLVGVEPIQEALLREITLRVPGLQIINGYGPTEATVCVTLYPIDSAQDLSRITPLGRPVHNIKVYVLNEQMEPVPIGVAGEIYLGGDGLARGYWQRAELTAERFVPDPFAEQAGGRLYRTGDRGRYLPDGNLEFLGRCDQQMKIRGFRIELGEIEAVFGQHPAIRDVLVVAREGIGGSKQVVAYVILASSSRPSAQQLRRYGQEHLPDYMLPSAFMLLDAFPLTLNGKIDYRQLPDPQQEREAACVAPRNQVEQTLAEIWEQLLGLQDISIFDNFFAMGGHSLLAAQVIVRIRERLLVDLPLRRIFEAPTIAELADIIENFQEQEQVKQLPPIMPVLKKERLPLSYAQQRCWLLEQVASERLRNTVSFLLRIKGNLNTRILERVFIEIVRRHDILRTSFVAVAGEVVQKIHPEVSVSLPVIDLRACSITEREKIAQSLLFEQTHLPFELAHSSLFRINLLRQTEDEHIVLIVTHQIVFDPGSKDAFLEEMTLLYEAFSHGFSSPLPQLSFQYADFALWQRSWFEEQRLQGQLDYWRQKLQGIKALPLPIDHPRVPGQPAQRDFCAFTIPSSHVADLKSFCSQEDVNLYMALLAAFQTLLYRYSGQEDIVIVSPFSGRISSDLENLIGCFINPVALRVQVTGRSTFCELLQQIRETVLEACAYSYAPLEKVVEMLAIPEDQSVAEIAFMLQNDQSEVHMSGLTLYCELFETQMTKSDLALSLKEEGDMLSGMFLYNANLFDKVSMTRLAENFLALLSTIVSSTDILLAHLQIL